MNEDICGQHGLSCQKDAPKLRKSLLEVAGLSELFKALADETRVKILHLLSSRPLCVCDLAFLLEMSLPAVSHHLRLLKTMRLLKSQRKGKQVFYELEDDHVSGLILQAKAHYIDRT